jgi:hypothetical protein
MRRIVRFAGLEEEGALDFVEDDAVTLGIPHSVSGNPMRFTSGRIRIRMDDEWRRALPRAERAKVTAIALPLLAPYGYLRRAARR